MTRNLPPPHDPPPLGASLATAPERSSPAPARLPLPWVLAALTFLLQGSLAMAYVRPSAQVALAQRAAEAAASCAPLSLRPLFEPQAWTGHGEPLAEALCGQAVRVYAQTDQARHSGFVLLESAPQHFAPAGLWTRRYLTLVHTGSGLRVRAVHTERPLPPVPTAAPVTKQPSSPGQK